MKSCHHEGFSQVPRNLMRQRGPAFSQVLQSKLPSGHIPLPDPAWRGHWLVFTVTAEQRGRGQDASLKGFPSCFHGFTFSRLCHLRCQDIYLGAQLALLLLFQEPEKWGRRGRWLWSPPTPTKGSIYPDEGSKPLHRAIADWRKTAGGQGQHSHGEEFIKPEAFSLEKQQTLHPLTFVRAPGTSSILSEMDLARRAIPWTSNSPRRKHSPPLETLPALTTYPVGSPSRGLT